MKSKISQIEKNFAQTIQKIFAGKFPKSIAVAVSGGSDSMALVFLLQRICQQKKCELIAITIDHKMRAGSKSEAKAVAKIMKENSIEHFIMESNLNQTPTANIEGSLREMRYNLLADFCVENNIEHLFIAHHGQDIAENFLIRLFRGSGIDGLAALDYISDFKDIKLVRPLIDFKKSQLEEYLSAKKIRWFHDETNDSEKYLRNKIRKFLLSLEDNRLISKRILLASKSILESRKLIEELMLERREKILEFSNLGYFLLNLDKFNKLSKQMAWRYLAWMLMDISGNYYKPRLTDLDSLYCWILEDKNHKARSFYGCIIEKYSSNKLIIYREKSKIKAEKLKNNLLWDGRFLINYSTSFQRKSEYHYDEQNSVLYQNDNEVLIDTINSAQLNQLSKDIPELKKLKNPLKKVYFTLPILMKDNKIIAIPHLKFPDKISSELKIIFKPKTKLIQNEDCTISN